jgi:alpha/beta superfamily hydrolase
MNDKGDWLSGFAFGCFIGAMLTAAILLPA